MNKIKAILKLIRVYQYPKNFFVFAPAFFSGKLQNAEILLQSILVFVLFSATSSVIYIINDLKDLEEDRLHPTKKFRPLPSGVISASQAYVILTILSLLIMALIIYFVEPIVLVYPIMLYVFTNLAYTHFFKNIALLDVFVLSFGFVLRILAGGEFTGITVSHWLFIMTFLVSLFLAFAKRRDDVLLLESNSEGVRKSSRLYSLPFLDVILSILVSVLIVCYILYTLSPDVLERLPDKPVYPSVIFVLLAMFRYLQKTIVLKKSGDPTKELFNDKTIVACIILWVSYFFYLLYF